MWKNLWEIQIQFPVLILREWWSLKPSPFRVSFWQSMCSPAFINYILNLQIIRCKSFAWSEKYFSGYVKRIWQSLPWRSPLQLKKYWSLWKILWSNKLISQKHAPKSSPQWSVIQMVSHQRRGPSRINVRVIVFLVYINQSPNGLFSNSILFANDASIFSVVIDHLNSSNKPNEDLAKIYQWAYRWKMSFNPEVSKQAQEVTFSCKKNISNHPVVFFNNLPINRKSTQIHLRLDSLD